MSDTVAPTCVCGHQFRGTHIYGKNRRSCLYCACGQFVPDAPNPEPIDYNSDYRKKLRRWRVWRKFRADLGQYFWGPCPVCKEFCAGQEWKDREGKISSIPNSDGVGGSGMGICPACTLEGRGWRNSGIYYVEGL